MTSTSTVSNKIWDTNDQGEHLVHQPSRPPVSRGPSTHVIRTEPGHQNETFHDGRPYLYGRIWRARSLMMEYAGEFFGTMVLVMFGTAANCQYNLSSVPAISPSPAGTWSPLSLGWGAGIALGVFLSGGHINPAVTLAMAVWRGFPWHKVPGYMLSQLLGSICGAAIVYGNYKTAIDIKEGANNLRTLKTAVYFTTVPVSFQIHFLLE
ncbi:Aquaglycerol porin AQY3 [Psilocybe cubensis]|uniref:Aquaporin-like protein n=2 Tax=Psilocybe cubensis TaxID=181762 RepID=A0A8H7XWK6_PSICU|nr:Aquaglycerol porin AQY3 [Psilocybe cubensis]KAH9479814.1 Aquaglycerol porin AQY3 [Psilocybe cubensis]